MNELDYVKVNGKENGADLMTKALAWDEIERHVKRMYCEIEGISREFDDRLRDAINLAVNKLELLTRVKGLLRVRLLRKRLEALTKGTPEA